jgi:hypothetical protein
MKNYGYDVGEFGTEREFEEWRQERILQDRLDEIDMNEERFQNSMIQKQCDDAVEICY